ncbi:MAG: cell wall metabolism sensor histidine kinase WalK [Clostridiaceae bacterium]|nr:cell wall metabolism sensor histidine kinase WalK [Clostridiaceae bacterium]
MFFRSIQWRLVAILVSTTLILMSVIWVFLNFQLGNIFYADFREGIERNYEELSINENTSYEDLEYKLINDPRISGLIRGLDKSFTIIRKSDEVIMYSSDQYYQKDKVGFRNEIYKSENLLAALTKSGNTAVSQNRSFTRSKLGDYYDYVRVQTLKDGDYILFFKYDRQRALNVIGELNGVIIWGMLVSILAALGIGYMMARTITRPISNIMQKAEKISRGDFGQKLDIESNDEIGKLAKTFNFMSSKLRDTLAEITSEKKKIETIMKNMTDGVVAFDNNGGVVHINDAARDMLGNMVLNLNLDTFLKAFNITPPEEGQDENGRQCLNGVQHRVEFGGRYLKLQFAAITDDQDNIEGLVTVIQDITEEQKLDNMRREFVANVSHELRTPLTSVKSYTETLLDGALGDPATTEHFLRVINDETDRMARLVRDLLILSQHDSGIRLNMEDISAGDLVASCVERLRREAEQKEQDLRYNIRPGIPLISGDRYRLDQLLVNVIGNAIKYTPEKGKITVNCYSERDKVIIIVEDNGIGIPEQDVERIFERFYRVDKARSRQMGGTGLGLAIAKEIAVLHGGNITAKSRIGRGTQVFIELPVKKTSAAV